MQSINVYTSSLVNEVLINAPRKDVPEALSHDSWCESPEVAYYTIVFVYFEKRLTDSLIMLRLIFVMKLEEHSRPDNVKGMCD